MQDHDFLIPKFLFKFPSEKVDNYNMMKNLRENKVMYLILLFFVAVIVYAIANPGPNQLAQDIQNQGFGKMVNDMQTGQPAP